MKKKLLLITATITAMTLGVVGMSAFEAHVINVTAKIENALSLLTSSLDFGTVFPQENFTDKTFDVDLSASFLGLQQGRVQLVDYKIEPKVKCLDAEQKHVLCVVGADSQNPTVCACPLGTTPMNDLCKFLSITTDDNNDLSRPSYFDGKLLSCDSPDPAIALGKLDKMVAPGAQEPVDISDTWTVDFKVPPVMGNVGQDWPVSCANWVVDQDSQDYGCDLWVEVTGISSYTRNCLEDSQCKASQACITPGEELGLCGIDNNQVCRCIAASEF